MADEATAQETTTENAPVETVSAPAETVDTTTPEIGGDVQATETATVDTADSSPEPDKQSTEKTYDEKYVKKLRDEAAAARVKGKEAAEQAAKEAAEKAQKELAEQIGKALGLIQDETPPAPEELLKQATEREAQIAKERDAAAERLRAYERKDALTAAASKVDGDLASLLDSRTVNAAIESLDTNADDFASQVEAIVSAAVENNPKLKKAPAQVAAPRSGGDMSGGNASPNSNGEKDVDYWRRDFREKRGLA
ncbi:hypothetical protein IU451_29215 [Nocardia cyriacigeorgica]|uniref:hypothetical protein n=1 Tax=Nocardia cyriacigeorgica TaxID=135487 RepID=UPI001893F921|nr:hypothetical protein [Nocardia cyriacigeorgica]MBF6326581.1 hypothetical protein [Nocardia cyriacigeorgica]